MSKRRILILGAGIMQLPAITRAREEGLEVIVADGNARAVGRDQADQFEHVDLRDAEAMLEMAKRQMQHSRLDAVFTAGTDFSSTVAYVAEHLGLPGISHEVAMNATDKDRMRTVLRRAGVPVPNSLPVTATGGEVIGKAMQQIGFPAVVKPVDNMGARGVVRVDNEHALLDAIADALPQSRSGKAIVEQFVPGPEFSIDALVDRGRVYITGIGDRHIRFAPHFVEVGHTIPSSAEPEDIERIVEVFGRAVAAVGIAGGAAKGDVILSPSGPVIGEIAARLSGGFMSGWTFPLASGVDLTWQAIRLALGEHEPQVEPTRHWTTAERAVISIPGVVRSIDAASSVHERLAPPKPNVEPSGPHWFWHISEGSEVVFPASNVQKCANVILAAPTRREATDRAEKLISQVVVELDPFRSATVEHLATAAHRAFSLTDSENRRWLDALGVPQWPLLVALAGQTESASAAKPLSVPLPPRLERENGRSWSFRSLSECLEWLEKRGEIVRGSESQTHRTLSALFWNALLSGGLQGALVASRLLTTR